MGHVEILEIENNFQLISSALQLQGDLMIKNYQEIRLLS